MYINNRTRYGFVHFAVTIARTDAFDAAPPGQQQKYHPFTLPPFICAQRHKSLARALLFAVCHI